MANTSPLWREVARQATSLRAMAEPELLELAPAPVPPAPLPTSSRAVFPAQAKEEQQPVTVVELEALPPGLAPAQADEEQPQRVSPAKREPPAPGPAPAQAKKEKHPITPATLKPSAPGPAPAAETSPSHSTEAVVQTLLSYFGLLVVERDAETNEAAWLACKFCPVYGCCKRRSDYIMAYDAPFKREKMLAHLRREHPKKWDEYCQAGERRAQFFDPARMAPMHLFEKRVAELKKCRLRDAMQKGQWERNKADTQPSPMKGQKKRKREEEMEKQHVRKRARIEQINRLGSPMGGIADLFPDSSICVSPWTSDRVIPSHCPEILAGRHCLTPAVQWPAVSRSTRTKYERSAQKGFRMSVLLDRFAEVEKFPTEITDMMINGELSDEKVRTASGNCAFGMPHFDFATRHMRITRASRSWRERWDRRFRGVVLFYLLHGLPLHVTAGLLSATEHVKLPHEGTDDVGDSIRRGAPIHRISEDDDNDSVEAVLLKDDEEVLSHAAHSVAEKTIERDVWNFGNTICALGLYLLRQILDIEHTPSNWAMTLLLLPCAELGAGAVEVLVSYAGGAGDTVHRLHLVLMHNLPGAVSTVIRFLDCVCDDWRVRLVGVISGLPAEDAGAKELEAALFETLCAKAGAVLKLMSQAYPGSGGGPETEGWAGMTGGELAEVIHANKARYALSLTPSKRALVLDALTCREAKLQQAPSQVVDACSTPRQATEAVKVAAPEAFGMIDGLCRVWRCDEPPGMSAAAAGYAQMGLWSVKGRQTKVVDVDAERVFWARALVVLHEIR